jgi:uncharacterized membrane protein YeaQ/YmgE (transglycosylase-associated protein family)
VHLPTLFQPHQSLAIILLAGLLGNWLAPRLGVHFGTGLVRTSLNATGGAIVLLLLVHLIRRV